jgi:hypothetical protein
MIRTVAKLVAPAMLVAVAACSDPLGPEDFAGTYLLQSVAGSPLPTPVFHSASDPQYVISESLVIRERGAVITRTVEERPRSAPARQYNQVSEYRLRVEGDHLRLAYVCPLTALCTEQGFSAAVYREPGGLRIEGLYQLGPLRYGALPTGLLGALR